MKRNLLFLAGLLFFLASCGHKECDKQKNDTMSTISENTIKQVTDELLKASDPAQKERIEKGVKQVATFWQDLDGDEAAFSTFCKESFISDSVKLHTFFEKTSAYFEVLFGYFNMMNLDLKKTLHLDMGPIEPVDVLFGSYDPSSHLYDDLYANKLAHTVLLNFPFYTLEEKETLGKNWSRKEWAYARMGDAFTSRTPGDLLLKQSEISTQADNYIAEYNIVMYNLLDNEGQKLFTDSIRLISHWGLRDELKANYSRGEAGLKKQKLIYEVMKRIVTQEIPKDVINNDTLVWNPYSNAITYAGKEVKSEKEPDTRYEHLLNQFKILRDLDAYAPYYPTYIDRAFEKGMEMRQEFVEQLFRELVASEQVKQVGALISERLGRNLEPFDIWYDGFKARSSINEDELTKTLKKKYPDVMAYQKDIPNLLVKLGYDKAKAQEIASRIVVDPARGAGHAWGAQMKGDVSHLRSRVPKDGMDYKGYNIGMHELGHNVEQTITLYDVDYYMLRGVPNTAFTEAMAFMFQKRDLALMGIKNNNPEEKYLQTLDIFWSLYEIMGVSLVDMEVWKWLYANPEATPEQLRNQVVIITKDIWNQYYAPVFGSKDEPVLGIYSHMIAYPLYLSAYPVGHLIEFQIEDYIATQKANFATETYRMMVQGCIVPQQWMVGAVNEELSNKPMFKAVDEALLQIRKK